VLSPRKQIKVILDNLVGLNKDLVLSFTEKYVINTLPQWRFISFADVEVAIALVYYIGEALPNSGGNLFTGGEVRSRQVKINYVLIYFSQPHALRNMMRVLVLNDLSSHSHSAVKLMYFETVVRYEKFFLIEPQHLEGVLAAFVDHRGIRNPNVKVQSRCTYLFSRFLKCVR
jgi:exportin-T